MRRVTSADGTRIAVHEYGDPGAPVLICIHGYPDNAGLWQAVAADLAEDFRVVAYDVRGAGESDQPRGRAAYRIERLQEDFVAVLAAVSPHRPVHLLAHDWGSIQSWAFVTSDELHGRIASYVSISGPPLQRAGDFVRERLRRRRGELVRQLLRSWYIFYFQLPWLPERGWRKGWAHRVFDRAQVRAGGTLPPPGARSTADYVNGLQLYRANLGRRRAVPRSRRTEIPVLVIAPLGDVFVTVPLQTEVGRWARDLRVEVVRGDHWLPRNDPGLVARLTREQTRRVAG